MTTQPIRTDYEHAARAAGIGPYCPVCGRPNTPGAHLYNTTPCMCVGSPEYVRRQAELIGSQQDAAATGKQMKEV